MNLTLDRCGIGDETPQGNVGVRHAPTATSPAPPGLPKIRYNLSAPGRSDYGYIEIRGDLIHRIGDIDLFYRTLGYTEEIRKSHILPEEFIWDRYTRDGAIKSRHCLQLHIATYLLHHSAQFREEYGLAYEALLSACEIAGGHYDIRCHDCPGHPAVES